MTVTDPVCGMAIEAAQAAATREYNGRTYYFCSEECKEDFDKHPEKFLIIVQKAPKGSVDPVCKMSVDAMDNSPNCLDNSKKVFFCSDHCRSKYLALPERYRGR